MRALIVGLGSIGRRHLANLRRLEPEAQITVWRHAPPQPDQEVPPQANRVVHGLEAALESLPEVAIIANPAAFHIETALALAQQGVDLLIEKPLSHSADGVSALLDLCRQRERVLMVGYNLRFNAALLAARQALAEGHIGRLLSLRAEVGQYLPEWRPSSDYRQTVSARRDLGGGVIFELSHELDYVRWLAGEVRAVSAVTGHLSDLEIDVEDTAEIILQFANGAVGSVHVDMVQRSMTRSCRFIGTQGTLIWDGISQEVRLYSGHTQTWTTLHAGSAERNEMFLEELRHFLHCVTAREEPTVSGVDGWRVLQIALAAHEASRTQRTVNLAA
jgi:predicted dehydrogenase